MYNLTKNIKKMNKEQPLKRLSMNIVNQLFDLADVPVEKRQAINDEADAFVIRLLPHSNISGSASDFEKDLYKLINAYVDAGLTKINLVLKMEYVTQSCRVS